jgi:AcrR family transcriptional regulator
MRYNEKYKKQLILISAFDCFAEHGYAGTSMSMIAKTAEVTQSLIYHHFENKLDLWHNVKQYIIHANASAQIDFSEFSTPEDMIISFINARVNLYLEQPKLIKLISWERLEANQEDLKLKHPITGNGLTKKIKQFQSNGEMDKSLDAEFITLFINSLITAPLFDNFTQLKEDTKFRLDYIDNLSKMIIKAVI